jgi:hypothetical protein
MKPTELSFIKFLICLKMGLIFSFMLILPCNVIALGSNILVPKDSIPFHKYLAYKNELVALLKTNDCQRVVKLIKKNEIKFLRTQEVSFLSKCCAGRGFEISSIHQDSFKQNCAHCINNMVIHTIDDSLKLVIDTLIYKDQVYRIKIEKFLEDGQLDSVNYYFKLQNIFDTQNIATLKSLTSKYGYPNDLIIGDVDRPHWLILHASLEDNLWFLDKMKKEALSGRLSWEECSSVLRNLHFRFAISKSTPFREIYLDHSGLIDLKKSQFSLYSLANFLGSNDRKLHIYLSKKTSQSEANNKNTQLIINQLVEMGVGRGRIIAHNERYFYHNGLDDEGWPFILHYE